VKLAYLIAGVVVLAGGALLWRLFAPAPVMNIGFASFGGQPVVVKAFTLNGNRSGLFSDMVVDGGGDAPPRTSGSGNHLTSYRKGQGDQIAIDVSWVELASGEAWRAAATVSAADLERSASGAIQILPVFAPGGLLIISSDPLPASDQDQRVRDLARVCATRAPDLDQDFRSDPRALPGLWEALQTLSPQPSAQECQS